MKGNEKIISSLNGRLADELTAIHQYVAHAQECENWKYERLADMIMARAKMEMGHAERVIERILFLGGRPAMAPSMGNVAVGATVPLMFRNDLAAEGVADKGYNETVRLAAEVGDNGTRELAESILKDEETHINEIEAQLTQIEQMGLSNYLAGQMGA